MQWTSTDVTDGIGLRSAMVVSSKYHNIFVQFTFDFFLFQHLILEKICVLLPYVGLWMKDVTIYSDFITACTLSSFWELYYQHEMFEVIDCSRSNISPMRETKQSESSGYEACILLYITRVLVVNLCKRPSLLRRNSELVCVSLHQNCCN